MMRVFQMDDYRRIAFFHHLIFTKDEGRMRNREFTVNVETAWVLGYNEVGWLREET